MRLPLQLPTPQMSPEGCTAGEQQAKISGQAMNVSVEVEQGIIPSLNQASLPIQLPNAANPGVRMPVLRQHGDIRHRLLTNIRPRLLMPRQNGIPPPPPLLPMGHMQPNVIPQHQNQIIISPGVQVNQMPVFKAMPVNQLPVTPPAIHNQLPLAQLAPASTNQTQVPVTQLVSAPANASSVTLTIIPGDQLRPAVSQSILSPTMVPVGGLIPVPRNVGPPSNLQAGSVKPIMPLPPPMKIGHEPHQTNATPNNLNKLKRLSNGPINGLAHGTKHTTNNVTKGKAKDDNNNKSSGKDGDSPGKPKSKRGRKLGQCKYIDDVYW